MCGIAGILHTDGRPAEEAALRAMGEAIRHRGPDGEGTLCEGPVGLVHRRLAVIDLTPAGRQPMASRDGRYVLVYNGEIYNFRELRLELESLGYVFQSRSDSEVVLYAFAEWGEQAVTRFNGMFAFAIYDRSRQELFLARDRYGIKPLYYARRGNAFLFGSEVKALLKHPACNAEVDRAGLLEYFTFQNFFTEHTLFEGVYLLPPATTMRVSMRTGAEPVTRQYWDYEFSEPEQPASEAEYIEELDRLFQQAVNRQLVSDVDVGSFLSGGMDSGSITSIAAQQLPYMRTFTCGFDLSSASGLELAFDERVKAEAMSYAFRTEHYEMVLKAGDMERCLPRLAWHLEEPRVGQSYPNYYAAHLASKFVKVVLSGAGGDELFGGYPWRYYRAVVNDDFDSYIHKYYRFWQRLIPNKQIKAVFAPIWKDVKDVWTEDIFRDVFHEHASQLTRPEDYVNHSLYFEARTFLHGLLVVEDKLNMAHGLEMRVPFLDNDLVDFAMKLPVNMKLGNLEKVVEIDENEPYSNLTKYFEKTRDGKMLLRKVMDRHLPKQTSQEIKQGFSAPDSSWFRGESMDFVRQVVFNRSSRIYEFMDPQPVQALVQEHLDGKVNRRLFIWSLLYFEKFLSGYTTSPQ